MPSPKSAKSRVRTVQPNGSSKLAGLSEIAALAEVSKQGITNWRNRFSTFPRPIQILAQGPVWKTSDVKLWLVRNRKGKFAK